MPNLKEPLLIRRRLTNSIKEVREPIFWQKTVLYTTSFGIALTALFSTVNLVGDSSDPQLLRVALGFNLDRSSVSRPERNIGLSINKDKHAYSSLLYKIPTI
jgi:hypothetical protein